MNRQEKTDEIGVLTGLLGGSQLAVVAEYSGLKVAHMVELRQELRKVSGRYRVVKNTLARIATKDTDLGPIGKSLKGPVGVAYTKADVAGVAKVVTKFAKDHPEFKLKGGVLAGGDVLDAKGLEALSNLPGKDQLRANLLATLLAAPSQFARLLAAPASGFVRVLEARRKQLAGE